MRRWKSRSSSTVLGSFSVEGEDADMGQPVKVKARNLRQCRPLQLHDRSALSRKPRCMGEPMAISGRTTLIAHLGYPTETFKAPMIYNPYFERAGIDAVVVPMGVKAESYAAFVRELFRLSNIRGALVTMPHKVTTVALLDEVTPTVRVAGSCNAILRRPDGSLLGDMFD